MTNLEDVGEFVGSVVAWVCNLPRENIDLDTNLQDIGVDSLMMPTIVAHIEAAYECEIEQDEVLELLQSVQVLDMVRVVERLREKTLGLVPTDH